MLRVHGEKKQFSLTLCELLSNALASDFWRIMKTRQKPRRPQLPLQSVESALWHHLQFSICYLWSIILTQHVLSTQICKFLELRFSYFSELDQSLNNDFTTLNTKSKISHFQHILDYNPAFVHLHQFWVSCEHACTCADIIPSLDRCGHEPRSTILIFNSNLRKDSILPSQSLLLWKTQVFFLVFLLEFGNREGYSNAGLLSLENNCDVKCGSLDFSYTFNESHPFGS